MEKHNILHGSISTHEGFWVRIVIFQQLLHSVLMQNYYIVLELELMQSLVHHLFEWVSVGEAIPAKALTHCLGHKLS